MDKEFVPYQESLELKELGFDEPCLCIYDKYGKLQRSLIEYPIINSKNGFYEKWMIITAPLYQQSFRWFREKYKKNHRITDVHHPYMDKIQYSHNLDVGFPKKLFNSYEEAELDCLRKLIEIAKTVTDNTQSNG